MNVEICASKVVADNPSASAPQQGDTQMACIATLVWMRVKADLREGPAGHSSGAAGPSLTSAGRRFPECLGVDLRRFPDRANTFPVLLFKIPCSSKSNSLFRCAGNFAVTLRICFEIRTRFLL
jgi:hypothetical protein